MDLRRLEHSYQPPPISDRLAIAVALTASRQHCHGHRGSVTKSHPALWYSSCHIVQMVATMGSARSTGPGYTQRRSRSGSGVVLNLAVKGWQMGNEVQRLPPNITRCSAFSCQSDYCIESILACFIFDSTSGSCHYCSRQQGTVPSVLPGMYLMSRPSLSWCPGLDSEAETRSRAW